MNIEEQILNALEGQRFVDWYEKDFVDYIEGAEDAKSKKEILEDIRKLFLGVVN